MLPGAALALVVWLVASLAFGFYVAEFGSYNKTYGTLAGIIVFLVWLWITNVALLFGAEFNAELERGRQMAAGRAGCGARSADGRSVRCRLPRAPGRGLPGILTKSLWRFARSGIMCP